MKILLAPDSYKGSLTAKQACRIMKQAIDDIIPDADVVCLPIADGGEGLMDSLLSVVNGKTVQVLVHDPLMREIMAEYAILDDGTAVIEMAKAAGLPLLSKDELDPLRTTTYGVGELIIDALDKGCRNIMLGLGGSATNDGGIGLACALGFAFKYPYISNGNMHSPKHPEMFNDSNECSGQKLGEILEIDTSNIDPRLKETSFCLACDVNNPLYGHNGAAYIYAPQKGASEEMVSVLDNNLRNYANLIYKQYGIDLQQIPGTGAAGGMAIPFIIMGNAKIESGLDLILKQLDFDNIVKECDIVITGEGCTDYQSAMGKALSGVAKHSAVTGVPVIAISGAVADGANMLYEHGMTALFSTCRNIISLDEALSNAEKNLYETTIAVLRLIRAVRC